MGFERLSLCGNHDESFLGFIDDPHANKGWLEFGGEQTLESYGIDLTRVSRHRSGTGGLGEITRATVPEAHISLLRRLPVSVRFGDVLFVHAGVRPGVPLEQQDDDDFMWIREPFVSEPNRLGLTVVHGHTPANEPVFAPGRIGIDTGAFATGRLTVLRVFGDEAAVVYLKPDRLGSLTSPSLETKNAGPVKGRRFSRFVDMVLSAWPAGAARNRGFPSAIRPGRQSGSTPARHRAGPRRWC